jgi:oligopeptide/dipeptide ABC transporter ATP-binding protein
MITVKDLSKTFMMKQSGGLGRQPKLVKAVDQVNFSWDKGKFMAIVGESGCGKSTLGRMLAGLIPATSGTMDHDGRRLDKAGGLSQREWARIVQLIPQDPYAAINPVRKIRSLFRDPILYHKLVDKSEVDGRIETLLSMVGLSANNVLSKYPHQLSGGQRQRLVVARALTVDPEYLVADEAVSMVDVSLRIGIMDSMKRISESRDLGLLFITHDFRVARYIAQNGTISVMYLGRVVEQGPTEALLSRPLHPYTQSLISAVPILEGREQRVHDIVPSRYELTDSSDVQGCAFAPRCPFADEKCRLTAPELLSINSPDHQVACHYAEPREVVVDISAEAG